jgi:putative transposase
VKYAWLHQQPTMFTVRRLWRLLAVSRSGSSEWLRRPPRAQVEAEPQGQAKGPHYFVQGRSPYGTRRLQYLLAQDGLVVSRRRIGRVLARARWRGTTRRRFTAPIAAGQAQTVAPNPLTRELTVSQPDTVYGGAIPALPTGGGWRYLAIVLELCSRAVVGWARAKHMRAQLVTQALSMALCQRHPAAGLRMHTDRGRQ